MLDIVGHDNGYIIGGKFFLTNGSSSSEYYNLMTKRGEDMVYGEKINFAIDYPGEYDIDGILFKVIEGADSKLNYLIRYEGDNIAIIQNAKIFDNVEFEEMNYWLYTSEKILNMIEQLELGGEKIKIDLE